MGQGGGGSDPSVTIPTFWKYQGQTKLQYDTVLNGPFCGNHNRAGFDVSQLFKAVNAATMDAKLKIGLIASRRSAISIGDMFEMQMLMNHLSQLSEMSSNVVAAANSAIMTMARNVKG